MAELKWKIETDEKTFRGKENVSDGAVHIRPEIPEGVIKKITAVLPLKRMIGVSVAYSSFVK